MAPTVAPKTLAHPAGGNLFEQFCKIANHHFTSTSLPTRSTLQVQLRSSLYSHATNSVARLSVARSGRMPGRHRFEATESSPFSEWPPSVWPYKSATRTEVRSDGAERPAPGAAISDYIGSSRHLAQLPVAPRRSQECSDSFDRSTRSDYCGDLAFGPTLRVLKSCRSIFSAVSVALLQTTTPVTISCSWTRPSSRTGQVMATLSFSPGTSGPLAEKRRPELLRSIVWPEPVCARVPRCDME